jgi:hypothetical protein
VVGDAGLQMRARRPEDERALSIDNLLYERVSRFGLGRSTFRSSVPPKSDAPRLPPVPEPFEFSEAHKDSFRALAASVSFVGACTLMFAGLSAVFALGEFYMGFVPNGVGTALAAALYGVMAWWMVSAGRSLSAMVRTRGQDVERLMEAVVQLRRLFGLARVVIIVLAMIVSGAGALLVWCNLMVERGGKCLGVFG